LSVIGIGTLDGDLGVTSTVLFEIRVNQFVRGAIITTQPTAILSIVKSTVVDSVISTYYDPIVAIVVKA
jgi:hypothetical protein